MNVRKRIMRLVDDCNYIVYVILYALGKKFGTNEILVSSESRNSIRNY